MGQTLTLNARSTGRSRERVHRRPAPRSRSPACGCTRSAPALPRVLGGLGVAILSTYVGLVTRSHRAQAAKEGVGGESPRLRLVSGGAGMSRIGQPPRPDPRGRHRDRHRRSATLSCARAPRARSRATMPVGVAPIIVSQEDGALRRRRVPGDARDSNAPATASSRSLDRQHGHRRDARATAARASRSSASGYRVAARKGKRSSSCCSASRHPVLVEAPAGIELRGRPRRSKFGVSRASTSSSSDEVAADIRKVRPPEPYKGKGVRYEGEVVRRKAGKAAGR